MVGKVTSATDETQNSVLKVSQAYDLMPTDINTKVILDSRAKLFAKTEVCETDKAVRREYIRFTLGPIEQYGIDYTFLEQILSKPAITQVPCTPAFIHGVLYFNGELLSVLNIHQFFNTRVAEESDYIVIVVKNNNMKMGILVDSIASNNFYLHEQLRPAIPSEGVTNMEYIKGIYQGNVTLLDIEALFLDDAIRVRESVS